MIFEIGKAYKNKEGELWLILDNTLGGEYPIYAKLLQRKKRKKGMEMMFTENGEYISDVHLFPEAIHNLTLIPVAVAIEESA